MNGFIEEVCTQGVLLEKCIDIYRGADAGIIDRIAAAFRERSMNKVIFTGMGSSLYAADAVLGYLTQRGILALSFSAFELSRYQFNHIDERTLVVVISQSGKSFEAVEIAQKARAVTTVVGIHNADESPLAGCCDYMLRIHADKEYSITNKTFLLTMFILNVLAHKLAGELDELFYRECRDAASWISDWLRDWEENSRLLYQFADRTLLFDLLANDASLATAKQLSLAYREGLHNCTAVWECADYAHGQYHSSKLGGGYLAQMFFPSFEDGTKEMKMKDYILDHGGKVMLYTADPVKAEEQMLVVLLPRLRASLMPLAESVAAETLLGMLLGQDWVKDH